MDRNIRCTAIVLAAGGSRRMGSPKALLDLDGSPLVVHHVTALAGHATRVVVVLGALVDPVRAVLPSGVQVVINEAWETTWPADSLRLALLRHKITGPCWVTPVDVPPAWPSTLTALVQAGPDAVPTGPSGRDGHPVLVGEQTVHELRHEAPEGGLRALLHGATRVAVRQEVAGDFDHREAWRSFVARREGGESG